MPTRTLFLIALAIAASGAQAEEDRVMSDNENVSSRSIALNQPVKFEFITMPRQVANLDIAQSVANAITLGGHNAWRLVGHPVVIEHERTHTIDVMYTLLPRVSGPQLLPQIPLNWLKTDQVATFGQVKVDEHILVGGDLVAPPKECAGVAGFAWGSLLENLKTVRIADNLIAGTPERTVATIKPGLELIFRMGELSAGQLAVPGLTLDQARESFYGRWGEPQIEEHGAATWILGWTRITATETDKGVTLDLVREDINDNLDHARIKSSVFEVLEGGDGATQQPAGRREPQRRGGSLPAAAHRLPPRRPQPRVKAHAPRRNPPRSAGDPDARRAHDEAAASNPSWRTQHSRARPPAVCRSGGHAMPPSQPRLMIPSRVSSGAASCGASMHMPGSREPRACRSDPALASMPRSRASRLSSPAIAGSSPGWLVSSPSRPSSSRVATSARIAVEAGMGEDRHPARGMDGAGDGRDCREGWEPGVDDALIAEVAVEGRLHAGHRAARPQGARQVVAAERHRAPVLAARESDPTRDRGLQARDQCREALAPERPDLGEQRSEDWVRCVHPEGDHMHFTPTPAGGDFAGGDQARFASELGAGVHGVMVGDRPRGHLCATHRREQRARLEGTIAQAGMEMEIEAHGARRIRVRVSACCASTPRPRSPAPRPGC